MVFAQAINLSFMKTIEVVDLKSQYEAIKDQIDHATKTVFNHGQFILGPEVDQLEKRLLQYTGSQFCIGVSNGTDALTVTLMALGVTAGDEVILPALTYMATAESVMLVGATPILVDIQADTCNIDPTLIESAITKKTKAIIAVNLHGQCADYDAIHAIAQQYNLPVIEDAAQSFGATYKGKKSCSLSTVSCTSFFPAKVLGCYGDGGACFTDDPVLAEKIRKIRAHGQSSRYHHDCLGFNARLDTLQAAILLKKLDIFPDEVTRRQAIAVQYASSLPKHIIRTSPYSLTGSYPQYVIHVESRDQVKKELESCGIQTIIHYPLHVGQQPVFISKYGKKDFPISDMTVKKILGLPNHPYLSDQDTSYIISSLTHILSRDHVAFAK